ncbi:MAG: hypothetical protein LQ337_007587, partial [Flavoplaca oasis]
METTRIRGGTPTAYVVQHRIDDPELLDQIEQLNQRSEQWMAQHIQEAVAQARAEYQYHPPPEMLDSDTEDESQLPSPASTPPPSPRNLTHLIQPQNTASTQMASLLSTLPTTHCLCPCSRGGIQPASNPYSPNSTAPENYVFTPKAACDASRPSATTNGFASDTELEDDPALCYPVHCISSTQLRLSTPAPGPGRSTTKSP